MRIGIAVSFMNGFGEKGQYHSQEVGLAKQFANKGHSVEIYKAVGGSEANSEKLNDLITVKYCPARNFGAQGLFDVTDFSKELNALVYFSDTQLSINAVDVWCLRNNVTPFYYVGSIESTSNSKIKKHLMDLHYHMRTLPIYRKRGVVAKTPFVKRKLIEQGVSDVKFAPVGIDFDLMDSLEGENQIDVSLLRGGADCLLLCVGRLERYKHPKNMLKLLQMLSDGYRLVVVGKGHLEAELRNLAKELGIANRIVWVSSVPNNEMIHYYEVADFFVNLNPDEIFGMAVVEAVYHGCRTLALSAPGPDYILSGMECHKTVSTISEMVLELESQGECNKEDIIEDRKRLIEKCSWQPLVSIVEKNCLESGIAK